MNKTVKEWFESAEPEIGKHLLARANYSSLNKECSSLVEAINQGFTWSRTPEGQSFWQSISSRNLETIKTCKELPKREFEIYTPKEVSTYDQYIKIKGMRGYELTTHYNTAPFDNCQNFSIASFENICSNVNEEECLKVIKYLVRTIKKTMMIVDIHASFEPNMYKFLKDAVLFRNAYTSTNGSNMVIVMFKFPKEYAA